MASYATGCDGVRQSRCLIRDALFVIFLSGYVTGMTEMTKKMEVVYEKNWQRFMDQLSFLSFVSLFGR